ncbi:MAG TPA: LysM peptidoglycan-binding domain-containing protein [Candidatus Acidoferrales bacterium]|nr:LysM peptidoglycan-binding domain-containing protein [Candidatus Acidoferrales bacterium]
MPRLLTWLGVFLLASTLAAAPKDKKPPAPKPHSEDDPATQYHRAAPNLPTMLLFAGGGVPDPVAQLLSQSEQAYRRGEEYFRAGRREQARAEFDRAVDLLLSSRWSVKEDPRLSSGLESLVERIFQLEVNASPELAGREARAGIDTNGHEPADVPAPMEEIPSLTFPPDPALRARLEQELTVLAHDLPIELNDRVLNAVKFFQTARGQRILETGLRRAGRYREMITSTLREQGLPADLIYVAQAESAFQPHARSRARAVGLWQFVKYRGQEYGLQVDWWIDERRDPVKSTRAAARHLRDLYQQFGDWYLVMAAYNCGPGCVTRAKARGGDDYWDMVERRLLPRETRNYVPIILAVTLMAKEPGRYGVNVIPDPPAVYDAVPVTRPVDLRSVAEALRMDLESLREMNPHVLRGVTPPDRDDFMLYVPPGMGETLRAELSNLPEAKRAQWAQHRVRRGETLSRIAARYDTSASAIAQANGFSVRSLLRVGDTLVIPQGRISLPKTRDDSAPRPTRASLSTKSSSPRSSPRRTGSGNYVVERGDTLSTIAAANGTTAQELAEANGLSLRSKIRPGQRLALPGLPAQAGREDKPAAKTTASKRKADPEPAGPRQHRVRPGETLWGLSKKYRTSISALRDANPFLSERELRTGDEILIPKP